MRNCAESLSLIKADSGLDDLKERIRHCGTVGSPLYIQDKLFTGLVGNQIALLEDPALKSLQVGQDTMKGCIKDILDSTIHR